jgi:putative cardiolipin synthase
LAAGCATSFPEVESDFEQDWQPTKYDAQVYLIPSADEAIARRIEMVRNTQKTLDVTYFSWDKDTVGLVLLNEIKVAADRGVDVRIVIDDLLVFDEKWLADLSNHPNIVIKIFNPFNSRKRGWFGRAVDFAQNRELLDHRIHEKYFNSDGKIMILGGRNIGDAYFGYSKVGNFFDMDVMIKGDVISPYEENYEYMWTDDLTTPITELIDVRDSQNYQYFRQELANVENKNAEVFDSLLDSVMILKSPTWLSVSAYPVFDSLQKIVDRKPYFRARAERLLDRRLKSAQDVLISTPYVIPHGGKFHVIDSLVGQNTKVRLITNSSSSNDSSIIPAYYEKYREDLLDKGVELYEYKDDAKNQDHYFHGESYYHNKSVIIDHEMTFVGSSNFDPRSDLLNIEFGLFIDSNTFALQVKQYLLKHKDALYWSVIRTDSNSTQWVSGGKRETSSPNYSAFHKPFDWLLRKLHVESEL